MTRGKSFHLAFEIGFDHDSHHIFCNLFLEGLYVVSVINVRLRGASSDNSESWKVTIRRFYATVSFNHYLSCALSRVCGVCLTCSMLCSAWKMWSFSQYVWHE